MRIIRPADVHDIIPLAEQIRVPAVGVVGDSSLILCVDVRTRSSDNQWKTTGGAMAEDLPNPNSLLIMRGNIHEFSTPEIFRLGQPEPKKGYSDPAIITCENHVMIAYARSADVGFFGSVGGGENNTLHVEIAHSYDGGITWPNEKTYDITSAVYGDLAGAFITSGHGVRHGTHWLLPMVGRKTDGTTVHVPLLSDDQGHTWSPQPHVGSDIDETAYGISPDGRSILLSGRKTSAYATGQIGRWYAESFDSGKSWSEPVFRTDIPAAPANAALIETPLGLMHCYPGAHRQGGYIALHREGTWENIAEFTHGPCGYVEAAVVNNTLVILYEVLGEIWMRCYGFPRELVRG